MIQAVTSPTAAQPSFSRILHPAKFKTAMKIEPVIASYLYFL